MENTVQTQDVQDAGKNYGTRYLPQEDKRPLFVLSGIEKTIDYIGLELAKKFGPKKICYDRNGLSQLGRMLLGTA